MKVKVKVFFRKETKQNSDHLKLHFNHVLCVLLSLCLHPHVGRKELTPQVAQAIDRIK